MSADPVIGDGSSQWADQETKLAMALLGKRKHYQAHTIACRHFNGTAKKVGYGDNAELLLQEIIVRAPGVVEKVRAVLPEGFSKRVADKVLKGRLVAARTLESAAAG